VKCRAHPTSAGSQKLKLSDKFISSLVCLIHVKKQTAHHLDGYGSIKKATFHTQQLIPSLLLGIHRSRTWQEKSFPSCLILRKQQRR
jgi:hypothetical protein